MSDSLVSIRARIAGLSLAASRDMRPLAAAGTAAFLSKFEREVDPDGVLPPAERARRALAARKLHFTRLALASVKARRNKKSPQSLARRGDGTTNGRDISDGNVTLPT